MKVYEMRIKIYLLENVSASKSMAVEADYIDSALSSDDSWLEYHEKNQFKNYCFSGFWPLEKDGIYKKDHIYTITLRTVDRELVSFFSKVLCNHYTKVMKGLTVENRVIGRKLIGQIYTLTPVVIKGEAGYWRGQRSLEDYERRLFENVVKKYNQFTNQKINEDFQLYTGITFLNKKPVAVEYKGIRLLGDKIRLQIADDKMAQEFAYFLLGVGLGEINARGCGYCNYRYI